ncbi:unnamed protein product, partial [Discosporangium mesarthrocarpum]
MDEVYRQLGLTGRAAIEGVTDIAAIPANALAGALNTAIDVAGIDPKHKFPDQAQLVSDTLTSLGFPESDGNLPFEIAKGMAGGGGGGAVASKAIATKSPMLAKGVQDKVAKILAENPGLEALAGASSTTASEITEEMGGGPVAQVVAALIGGAGTPASVGAVRKVSKGAADIVEPILSQTRRTDDTANIIKMEATDSSKAAEAIKKSLRGKKSLTDQTSTARSRDPGLLNLEKGVRNQGPSGARGRLSQRTAEQNLKRQKILDVMGRGNPQAERKALGDTMDVVREKVFDEGFPHGSDAFDIFESITKSLKDPSKKRVNAEKALSFVQSRLAKASDEAGFVDTKRLYSLRRDVSDAINGKIEGDKLGGIKHAGKELVEIKQVIDDAIEEAAPGYKEYLESYAKAARKID